ncbi:hypothetical protein NN561_014285 [Cricetulus griseus]
MRDMASSRGAVRLGQGDRVPTFICGQWRELGFLGFCGGGRLDGQRAMTPDRKRGTDEPLAWSWPGLGVNHAGLRRVRGGARRAQRSRELLFPNGRAWS